MDDLSIFAVIFFFIRFIHIFCVILPLFCSFLLKHSNNTHSYSEKRGEHTFLTHKFQRLEHHSNSETGKNTTEQERNKILIFIILNCIQWERESQKNNTDLLILDSSTSSGFFSSRSFNVFLYSLQHRVVFFTFGFSKIYSVFLVWDWIC